MHGSQFLLSVVCPFIIGTIVGYFSNRFCIWIDKKLSGRKFRRPGWAALIFRRMRPALRFIFFAGFLCLFLMPFASLAFADTAAATTSPLASFLTNTVFPLATALIAAFVAYVLKKVGQKFHIESLTAENNMIQSLAMQGVALAEEKAADWAKKSGPKLSGSSKLETATAYILANMPKVTQAQADSAVHSVLAQISGVGATGAQAVAPAAMPEAAAAVTPAATPDPAAS